VLKKKRKKKRKLKKQLRLQKIIKIIMETPTKPNMLNQVTNNKCNNSIIITTTTIITIIIFNNNSSNLMPIPITTQITIISSSTKIINKFLSNNLLIIRITRNFSLNKINGNNLIIM
jgi:hypothetical protein